MSVVLGAACVLTAQLVGYVLGRAHAHYLHEAQERERERALRGLAGEAHAGETRLRSLDELWDALTRAEMARERRRSR